MTISSDNTIQAFEPEWIPHDYLVSRDLDTLIGRMAVSTLIDVERPLKGFDDMKNCDFSEIVDKIHDIKAIISLNEDPVLIKNLEILQQTLLNALKSLALKLHGQSYEFLSAGPWMDEVISSDEIDFEKKCQFLMNPRLADKNLKPLMEAILQNNDLNRLRALLKLGANIQETNPHMILPAIFLPSKASLIRELLSAGASVHDRDDKGNTALHWSRTTEVAKELLKAGADPNAKGYCNRTPLHNVTRIETAKLLLEAGADLDIQDFMGETSVERAEKLGLGLELFRSISRILSIKKNSVSKPCKKRTFSHFNAFNLINHHTNPKA